MISGDPRVDSSRARAGKDKVATASTADATKEIELVALTDASVSRHDGLHSLGVDGRQDSSGARVDSGGADQLKLRGCIWEHIGLPRHMIGDILSWAQRHVLRPLGESSGWDPGSDLSGADQRRGSREPLRGELQSDEEAAMAKTMAQGTMGVLQGLFSGEVPRGFNGSLVDSPQGPEGSVRFVGECLRPCGCRSTFSPPVDVLLDPFSPIPTG